FGHARIVFRRISWGCVVLLIVTGIYMSTRRMNVYIENQFPMTPTGILNSASTSVGWQLRTGYWWAAHGIGGIIAILISIYMLGGDRPPRYPVNWLRLDLMVL